MARYTPANVPLAAESLPEFLGQELQRIAQAKDTADSFLTLEMLYAAPAKYRDGTVCLFDGTTFNPGSGGGVYCYRAGAWRFLG